jgi:predicted PurR-regulated permease PerM
MSQRILLRAQGRTTLVTFLVILGGALYLGFKMVRPYLLAVIFGAILSVLTFRAYRFLRKHRLGPKTASAIVTIATVLIIVGPIAGFVEMAVSQAAQFIKTISQEQGSLSPKALVARVSEWEFAQRLVPDPAALEKQISSSLQNAGKAVTAGALGVASSLPDLLLQLALAGLSCFFLLIDGRKLLHWILSKIPLDRDVQKTLITSLQETTISSILATLAAAGVQAAIMLVSFIALGVPMAVLAAGATFVFAWIPILGSTPVWVAGTIYLYTQDSPGRAIAMLALGLITSVSDNLVRPLVLKGRGDMHPLLSLVAIFGGIEMFGIIGVFIGPVIAAVVVTLLNVWPTVGRRFGLLASTPAELLTPPATTLERGLKRENRNAS